MTDNEQKINYQKILDKTIDNLQMCNKKPSLLLHSCCAPGSSYVLEYLSKYFDITVYYYNPNIYPESEFEKRAAEQTRLVKQMQLFANVIVCGFNSNEFYAAVKGLENEKEGGARCIECFKLRLEKSAQYAAANNFDYYTTTLTISPLKNARAINDIGMYFAQKYNIKWLLSDFKKREGFKRSTQLSLQYGLYRQNYCGCVFSKNTDKTGD